MKQNTNNQNSNIDIELTEDERRQAILGLIKKDVKRDNLYGFTNMFLEEFSVHSLLAEETVKKNESIPRKQRMITFLKRSAIETVGSKICKKSPLLGNIFDYLYAGTGPLCHIHKSFNNNDKKHCIYPDHIENTLNGLVSCAKIGGIKLPSIFLHGPSGTGKSSFSDSVAHSLKENMGYRYKTTFSGFMQSLKENTIPSCFIISSLDRGVSDDSYTCLLAIEEIDKDPELLKKHLPELLLYLDSRPDRVSVIITSNLSPEHFPAPLLRAGRIDIIQEIPFMDEKLALKLFNNLLPSIGLKALKTFKEYNNVETFQPAAISSFCNKIKREAIVSWVSEGKELPKCEDRVISFFENFKATAKDAKGKHTYVHTTLRKDRAKTQTKEVK